MTRWTVAILLLIPFALLCWVPIQNTHDMTIFLSWSEIARHGWSDLYVNCPRCNYPYLGAAFIVAGMTTATGCSQDLGIHPFWLFRGLLACLSILNSLLLWRCLQLLAVPTASRKAVLIALLPSTFMVEYVWGNIDGLVQFVVWLCLTGLGSCYLSRGGRRSRLGGYFSGTLALCALPMVKQTALFSLPALAIFWLIVSLDLSRSGCPKGTVFSVAAVASLPTWTADHLFQIPPWFAHHLHYIWAGVLASGSPSQSQQIAANGFNLWVLLGRPQWSSSLIPFWRDYTPQGVGLGLFLGSAASALFLVGRLCQRRLELTDELAQRRFLMACVVLLLAFFNLSFNVFLTGTHERYLAHFYPFVLVAAWGGSARALRGRPSRWLDPGLCMRLWSLCLRNHRRPS